MSDLLQQERFTLVMAIIKKGEHTHHISLGMNFWVHWSGSVPVKDGKCSMHDNDDYSCAIFPENMPLPQVIDLDAEEKERPYEQPNFQ